MNAQQYAHILLVDDEPAEQLLIARRLSEIDDWPARLAYVETIDAAVAWVGEHPVDIVLLDNRLQPSVDFRQTAPRLREAGFTGPIGIISSDITGDYFQSFPEYGVDFRIGKDEIDNKTLAFILEEYLASELPDACHSDLD